MILSSEGYAHWAWSSEAARRAWRLCRPTWAWQQSSTTVAQASEQGPSIAFIGIDIDVKDLKKDLANRDTALAELVKQLGLAPLKR